LLGTDGVIKAGQVGVAQRLYRKQQETKRS
jgi:hypothetical protein